ncbi:hypothetical protein CMT52_10420 [Elizabethkingia anophelis]|nr:hypothetical protein [Elizabethkingia anophelis]MDV4024749.1 hypothetical protein [Elizabethkingia anophelis]
MKKQNINKKLLFKKEIVKDLKSISGGIAPATQPVNTYRCAPTYGGVCGPDPVTNPNTCDCGGSGSDTRIECDTKVGAGCVVGTLSLMGCVKPD